MNADKIEHRRGSKEPRRCFFLALYRIMVEAEGVFGYNEKKTYCIQQHAEEERKTGR